MYLNNIPFQRCIILCNNLIIIKWSSIANNKSKEARSLGSEENPGRGHAMAVLQSFPCLPWLMYVAIPSESVKTLWRATILRCILKQPLTQANRKNKAIWKPSSSLCECGNDKAKARARQSQRCVLIGRASHALQ